MVKSLRLLYILEAVEQLQVAAPADILRKLAARSDADQSEANLKRTIYRDLKHLADHGRLQVRYLTPEGQELSPDEWDERKNLRVEYRLAAARLEQRVPGHGLLAEFGAMLVPPSKRALAWKVSEVRLEAPQDRPCLIFQGQAGKFIALHLPADQLPVKLLFSRTTENVHDANLYSDEAEETFGLRTTVLLVRDSSVSRHTLGLRSGHALLSIDGKRGISLLDLKSSSGTGWAALAPDQLDTFLKAQSTNITTPANLNPFHGTTAAVPDTGVEVSLPNPCLVQLGGFKFLVTSGIQP